MKRDDQLFNYPGLHRAIGLKTLRTLPYLAEKYQTDKELMKLWELLSAELEKNQKKRYDEYSNRKVFPRIYTRVKIEIA